jgi:hypothetical protein
MTSFNHHALGAVANWMHNTIAGLAPAVSPSYREDVRIGGTGRCWLGRVSVSVQTRLDSSLEGAPGGRNSARDGTRRAVLSWNDVLLR